MGIFDRFKTPGVCGVQAREMVRDGAQLIDVRESSEWNAGHAPQASHIPSSQVTSRLNRVKKEKAVVVVCRSGGRSRAVTKQLRSLGYEAFTLQGGMRAWQGAEGPVLDRKGRPGRIV